MLRLDFLEQKYTEIYVKTDVLEYEIYWIWWKIDERAEFQASEAFILMTIGWSLRLFVNQWIKNRHVSLHHCVKFCSQQGKITKSSFPGKHLRDSVAPSDLPRAHFKK